jgi:hypothetical protein
MYMALVESVSTYGMEVLTVSKKKWKKAQSYGSELLEKELWLNWIE